MGRAVAFVFVAVLLAEPAHAQIVRPISRVDRSFDVSGALALNRIDNVNAIGGAISIAGYFEEVVGLVFDAGVYKEPQANTIVSLAFGPRISLPGWNSRTRVFGQVLVGARMSNAVEGSDVIQPGAGIDVRTPIGMKLRFEVDYAIMRGAPPGPRSIGGTRALIGVAIPIDF